MKKVLFLVHEFFPYGSAITNCIDPIIKEMLKSGINVSVVTRRTHSELKKYEKLNGVEIFRINDLFHIYHNRVLKSRNNLEKLFNKIILKLIWLYRTKIKKESEGFLNEHSAYMISKKIIKNQDVVISCSYPFSMHKIAARLKEKYNIPWVAYQFDPHSYNYTLDSKLKNERLLEEINILKRANRIFLPNENYEDNLKNELKILKDKYYPIDFALIKERRPNKVKFQNSKIKFVYTGTFYEDIRTPDYMFEFLEKVNLDFELHLYYFAEENVEKKIMEYKHIFKDKLFLYRNKSKEECDKALASANIIINVGNKISNQTPSKVYECISLGKPIINFYSILDDTSKKVLARYPLVLNIFKDNTEKDLEKFEKFCNKNKNVTLAYEEATKKYKNANEVAKEFIEEVKKCCENKQNQK